jgi:hypothetical protein
LKKLLLLTCTLAATSIFCYETPESCDPCYKNWFKGGALSFSGLCLKKGDYKIINKVFIENVTHFYDKTWLPINIPRRVGVTEIFDLRIGFLPRSDLSVIFREQSQHSGPYKSSKLADTSIRVAAQLSIPISALNSWGWRLLLEQTFPTGHYKNLNPEKKDVEASGLGYYRTKAILAAEVLTNIEKRLLRTRVNLSYGYSPTSCWLTNYNIYGGGLGTKGKLGPVHECFAILGFEYTLTQNVCLVSDFEYSYSSKASFKGIKGKSLFGTEALTERPVFKSVNMAPGLQINFSYNWGLNFCCWFSAAGKNTPSFQSALIELIVRN